MRLDVIGMPVAAEVVVGHQHLGADLPDDRDQVRRCVEQVAAPEGLHPLVGCRAHHAGVAIAPAPAKEPPVVDSEQAHRLGEFAVAMVAEAVLLVGRQVLQPGDEDLALLTQGAGDERDADPLVDVAGHGDAGADRLVVGVGMHEEDPPVGHGPEA